MTEPSLARRTLTKSVWAEISASIGAKVLIGHTLDFDLAVLALECERIGATFNFGPPLDVRLMAELAEPSLADFSLESLATWLGVKVTGRHSALGRCDHHRKHIYGAGATLARPRHKDTRGNRARVGSLPSESAVCGPSRGDRAGRCREERNRIDVGLYRQRVASIMTVPAHIVGAGATLGEALEAMTQKRISSVFVSSGQRPVRPQHAGIITERDVLRALNAHGARRSPCQ